MNLKTSKLYILLFGCTLFLTLSSSMCSGEPDANTQRTFTIVNNTKDTIYVHHNVTPKNDYDTLLSLNRMYDLMNFKVIYPGEVSENLMLGSLVHFMDEYNTNWNHHLVFFKKETLDSHSNDELKENMIYDAYYILTTKEIASMNYTVPFPVESIN